VQILSELKGVLEKIDEGSFQVDRLNKDCSLYLYENAKRLAIKNEDLFSLVRFAATGNPVGAPVGDILEILGKQQVLTRLANALDYFRDRQNPHQKAGESGASGQKVDAKEAKAAAGGKDK
jgi:glutamyl/glutaminyl-tRNA synthetase